MSSISSLAFHNFCPNFISKTFNPSNFNFKPPNCANSAQITTLAQIGEEPKLRWTNLKLELTQDQKRLISQLPETMSNRCKALVKRLICFSSQNETLNFILAAWVKSMKPQRADWLAVLKELNRIDLPLCIEVTEYALLEDTFEANIRDYTKLIHTYGEQNNLEKAEKTLNDMKGRGFFCDQVTLTALINMYSKAGKLNRSIEIFEEMKLLGFSIDKRAYGAMIMAFIRAEMLEKAEYLIKESENKEIYSGKEVYKALLRAYSNKGDSRGAQRVYDSMQFARILPDSRICALLIKAYCFANEINEARCVIQNMRKVGVRPCERCINYILNAYEKENRLDYALRFLKEIERDGVRISKGVLEVLNGWFERIGVKEEMEGVLKEIFEAKYREEFERMERNDGFYGKKTKYKGGFKTKRRYDGFYAKKDKGKRHINK
ncbi:hypothetical protein LUZ60_014017 [Juncus effusus]|nr:hypothetical protein LUZ60_014017 [Juncus effusus]